MLRVASARFIAQKSGCAINRNFASTGSGTSSNQSQAKPTDSIPDVQGFSDAVLKVPNQPVGFAGASKDKEYKNPEYFCYHVDSFADSMIELDKYRLPAPSSKTSK